MTQNYGLARMWPDLTEEDLENLQRVNYSPNAPNVALPNKGYNEFVLYGQRTDLFNIDLQLDYYNIYTALTWTNPLKNRPVSQPFSAYGLFIQNSGDYSLDGWLCEIAPGTQYGWLCSSFVIANRDFDPTANDLPIERKLNSWWQCGCENKNTYT